MVIAIVQQVILLLYNILISKYIYII